MKHDTEQVFELGRFCCPRLEGVDYGLDCGVRLEGHGDVPAVCVGRALGVQVVAGLQLLLPHRQQLFGLCLA